MKLLVTGGAGFVGSAVVRQAIAAGHEVVNVDALTETSCVGNLASVAELPSYSFEHADVCDRAELDRIFADHEPDAVMHLAAASAVDRAGRRSGGFLETNTMGTFHLLEAACGYWEQQGKPEGFRFHQVSGDDIHGRFGQEDLCTEQQVYDPRTPVAASKAAAEQLARAWHHDTGLPVVLSNAAPTYGPYQFPDKFIPSVVLSAIEGKRIPIHGKGADQQDWLYVEDHAHALLRILQKGTPGHSHHIGGDNIARNIDVVRMVCTLLDQMRPEGAPHSRLMGFVLNAGRKDAIPEPQTAQIRLTLGWQPSVTLEEGLRRSVRWYLDHEDWCRALQTRETRIAEGAEQARKPEAREPVAEGGYGPRIAVVSGQNWSK